MIIDNLNDYSVINNEKNSQICKLLLEKENLKKN